MSTPKVTFVRKVVRFFSLVEASSPATILTFDFSTEDGGYGGTGTQCVARFEVNVCKMTGTTHVQGSETHVLRMRRLNNAAPTIDDTYPLAPNPGSGNVTFDISSNALRVRSTVSISGAPNQIVVELTGTITSWDEA